MQQHFKDDAGLTELEILPPSLQRAHSNFSTGKHEKIKTSQERQRPETSGPTSQTNREVSKELGNCAG